MLYPKLFFKRFFGTIALSSCLVTGLGAIALAQNSNPGLTIFSGIDRENILSYHLDFGGNPNSWDRYRLRIPGKKMTQGASKFIIAYPDYYDGKFDTDKIEVRVKGESLPIRDVYWDKESRILEIDLEKPVEASHQVELVLSNVKNPRFGGTYYFHAQMMAANDIPVRQYVGTWILSIN